MSSSSLTSLLASIVGLLLLAATDGATLSVTSVYISSAGGVEPTGPADWYINMECYYATFSWTIEGNLYSFPPKACRITGSSGGVTTDYMSPLPTILLYPGDQLTLTFTNTLAPGQPTTHVVNTFHSPDCGNIHTHGLHISSTVDDVTLAICPGDSHTYVYEVLKCHFPGPHWYHAHYHGSTEFWVLGGVAGPMIVLPPKQLPQPPELVAMSRVDIFMWNLNIDQWITQSDTIGNNYNPPSCSTGAANCATTQAGHQFLLVNGAYMPTLTVAPGEFTQLLLWNAEALQVAELELSSTMIKTYPTQSGAQTDTTDCVMYKIGTDGIYLPQMPSEPVEMVYLAQAARAEVVMTCSKPGTYYLNNYYDAAKAEAFGNSNNVHADQTVLIIEVDPTATAAGTALPTWLPSHHFSPYLRDLRHDEHAKDSWTMDFSFTGGFGYLNEQRWVSQSHYLRSISQCNVHEWCLGGIGNFPHPFHLHVNPFQIISRSEESQTRDPTGLVGQAGEWHDVLSLLHGSCAYKVRFQTADFGDQYQMMHCHILSHEDQGMMGLVWLEPGDCCGSCSYCVKDAWEVWYIVAVVVGGIWVAGIAGSLYFCYTHWPEDTTAAHEAKATEAKPPLQEVPVSQNAAGVEPSTPNIELSDAHDPPQDQNPLPSQFDVAAASSKEQL